MTCPRCRHPARSHLVGPSGDPLRPEPRYVCAVFGCDCSVTAEELFPVE